MISIHSPVSMSMFGTYYSFSLLLGLILLGAYFVYQMKASDKSSRTSKFFIEMILAIAASIFLGTGVFFMCLDFDLWL